jgi:dienelactone hydrolase
VEHTRDGARSMKKRGLTLVGLVVLVAGCSGANPPSPGPSSVASHASVSAAATAQASQVIADASVIPLPTDLPISLSYADAMRLFEYDRSRPFDIVETSVLRQAGASIHDITYLEASGARTQAYLVLPDGPGPFGGVMYLHGAGGGSSEFMSEGVDLAQHGVASLLITAPEWKSQPATHAEAVTEIVFEMRELRRSLDLLATRPEVDATKLGFVGFSFGAIRGGTFAGIEGPRLKVAILMSTPPSYGLDYMAPFDPIAWAPHVSPAAFYLQEGAQDTWFTHDQAESLIAAANEPKKLVWYDAGHGLNQAAYDDRLSWIEAAVGG